MFHFSCVYFIWYILLICLVAQTKLESTSSSESNQVNSTDATGLTAKERREKALLAAQSRLQQNTAVAVDRLEKEPLITSADRRTEK